MPIFLQPALVVSYGMHATPLHPGHSSGGAAKGHRGQTLFFAGRICGDRG